MHSHSGWNSRLPRGCSVRAGSSTWTKPGRSATRSISATASAGIRIGTTTDPRRRGSGSSHSRVSQSLTAPASAAATSGWCTLSTAYRQVATAASTPVPSSTSARSRCRLAPASGGPAFGAPFG